MNRMRVMLILRSNLLFLCLLGLAFVLDQFGFYDSSSLVVAGFPAILSAIGGIASSIGNIFGQKEANEQNLEQNRQNQMFMAGENAMNRRWQERMWNLQNQYNTPSALKQRLKEAGWNPFLTPDSVGSASNAGAAGTPAMSSAPSRIPVQPLNYGGFATGVSDAVGKYLQLKSVDANVANQNAETTSQILDNAKELYKVYGKEQANRYLQTQFASLNGNVEGGLYARQALADVQDSENQARLSAVNAAVAEKFGVRKADVEIRERERTIDKISQDIMESGVRMNKMGSDIKLIEQKVKESVSSYWRNLAEAGMFKKLGDKYVAETSTINALRDGLVTQLETANNRADLMYQTESTIFEADEGVRGYLTSKDAKENRAKSVKLDNNRYVHAVERSTQIVKNFLPDFIVPITGSGVSTTTGGSSGSVNVSGFVSYGQ